ncbi:arsenate-mycothiol transferase ArsC [Aporhodopirellula aestuarii]|uniref:Protein tyrosine phosphatase n=1 Tax=Aporhodopirellula aestuarii TaxID=2950107 RepID=A0ABT0UBU6_9BACT|nr:protein tyrosine phosphatase [Aporhodopirellula aestuarii]MCM2374467.1 protein tyrosine phosphatase [Aporhodopirellula aestuarii]
MRTALPADRQELVNGLADRVEAQMSQSLPARITFICTHNSRRSQFAQVWAQTAAAYFGMTRDDVVCYSGGTEATACNPRTIASLARAGFVVTEDLTMETGAEENRVYDIAYSQAHRPVKCFSKVYDTCENPSANYIAVMCCDHAEANCPVVRGASLRVPMFYTDPKVSDDSSDEAATYDLRNRQIATEMWIVMGEVAERRQTKQRSVAGGNDQLVK